MNTARIIQNFGFETLDEKGARLGDQIILSPPQGKNLIFNLSFRRYSIQSTDSFSPKISHSHIELPKLGLPDFKYEIELCTSYRSKQDEHARYIIRSLNGIPFRLNGLLCFEAFVEREDQVDIGFSRLNFTFSTSTKISPEHPVLKNLSLIKSNLSILIEGETGTGKTRLAKQIHERSGKTGPFVHLNLSAFNPALLESELFGHVKGAFTGAINSKRGALTLADGGTLFLDEIDSLPWDIQTKLLLFLDDYKVKPVGSEQSLSTSPRLIFASGSSLSELVSKQQMRKDFFYRLNSGYILKLPSLRNSPQLIHKLCEEFEKNKGTSLSPSLIKFYSECFWPGNIRQLLGHLEKKWITKKNGHLQFDELDEELSCDKPVPVNLENNVIPLNQLKKEYVRKIYNQKERKVQVTADLLQISPSTLRSLLREDDQMATMALK